MAIVVVMIVTVMTTTGMNKMKVVQERNGYGGGHDRDSYDDDGDE